MIFGRGVWKPRVPVARPACQKGPSGVWGDSRVPGQADGQVPGLWLVGNRGPLSPWDRRSGSVNLVPGSSQE